MTPTHSTSPTAHAISARPWPSSAINACASVRARMNSGTAAAKQSVRSTVAEVELVAEEDLADGRPDGGAGDDAEHADAEHDHRRAS